MAALSVGYSFGEHAEFSIVRELGEGSQAKVYACEHRDGAQHAVKVLGKRTSGYRDVLNFEREQQCLRCLKHQSIVQMSPAGAWETEDHLFLVMELGQGDLQQYIDRAGPLKEPEARHVFKQLLEATNHMHSKGILHRDLKLDNVIIDGISRNAEGWNEMSVKVGDLGLSKRVSIDTAPDPACAPPMPALERATTEVGTFLAPEVRNRLRLESGACYDAKVDYFGLGIVLYMMLTGDNPGTVMQSISEIEWLEGCFSDREAFRGLPSAAKELISGLMKVDAAARFGYPESISSAWVCRGY